MMLRGIDFGSCIDASGLRGFFGEGYWFHRAPFVDGLWYNFHGSTFVSKTTNYLPTKGNMPLTDDHQPRVLFPKCIWVDFFGKKMLNAVGLSGPGAKFVFNRGFEDGLWPRDKPFMISVAPEGKTTAERVTSFESLVTLLESYTRRHPWHRFGLQINLSCPNSKVDPSDLIREAGVYLDYAIRLKKPIVIKVNLLVPMEVLKQISEHPACDAICMTNTLPFGELPHAVPWKKWFPNGSPLARFGGGGLSGAPLFPLLLDAVAAMRRADINKSIIAGGGILHPDHVNQLVFAGLRLGIDAISIGSIAILAPWNIPETIERAHELLGVGTLQAEAA